MAGLALLVCAMLGTAGAAAVAASPSQLAKLNSWAVPAPQTPSLAIACDPPQVYDICPRDADPVGGAARMVGAACRPHLVPVHFGGLDVLCTQKLSLDDG